MGMLHIGCFGHFSPHGNKHSIMHLFAVLPGPPSVNQSVCKAGFLAVTLVLKRLWGSGRIVCDCKQIAEKIGKVTQKLGFGTIFLIFRLLLSYSLEDAET